jgi:hypothetical protein
MKPVFYIIHNFFTIAYVCTASFLLVRYDPKENSATNLSPLCLIATHSIVSGMKHAQSPRGTVLVVDILSIPSTQYAQEKVLEVSNISEIEDYQLNSLQRI